MNNLYLSVYNFKIRAIDTLVLPPYKGSTLRGGFGHAFKKVVCVVRNTECRDCSLFQRCVYTYVFETVAPAESPVGGRYQDAPHPFILNPPLEEKRVYEKGEVLSFQLVLVGRGNDYLPYFVFTFDELGRRGIGKGKGRYKLDSVSIINSSQNDEIVYSGVDQKLKTIERPISFNEGVGVDGKKCDSLTVRFLSPTRLKAEGRLVSDRLEFVQFIKALLERLQLLSHFHCGGSIKDLSGYIKRAGDVIVENSSLLWYDWERYSNRKGRMKLGGFKGTVTYKGDISEFVHYINVGKYLNIGKGTVFGLGRYGIEWKEESGK